MKRISAIILASSMLFFTCKKKNPEGKPEPETPVAQTGVLSIKVTTYDTLGNAFADHSGVKVVLQNGTTANTNSGGEVSFSNLPYGTYAPSLIKSKFDGPPLRADLAAASQTLHLPFPQHSTYSLSNLQASIVTRDSVTISFKLDKPIPAGQRVKIAVLTSTANTQSSGNYGVVDIISVNSQTITNFNIARNQNFKTATNDFPALTTFFVGAVPVSYGLYESNLSLKPYLLGESLNYPGNIQLKKNW